ncbi:MAG TPA: hypothetical protein VL172_04585, partial [Kofleriaceae bacterium]|nr:hypothetical protein [Kofleriaceae bacterium]
MMRVASLLAGSLVALAGAPAVRADRPTTGYRLIPSQYANTQQVIDGPTSQAAGTRWIFYMNKNGGTYTPGINNSTTNRSTIPSQVSTVPPWNVSDAAWQQIMTCVRSEFSAFNVDITDVDPGNVAHIESVVAGQPGDVQMPNGVGGVSPFTNDCSTIPNSIVFTFAEVYGNQYQTICEVIGQEVSHSFGLDHEFLCQDPMTYLSGCGAKTFQDTDAQCGEDQPRTCACGQSTQNSVQMLSQRIGVGDAVAPTVSIASPSDGATVGPGFSVS